MGLTEQERERLTDWVFSQTDAKVISDPNFRVVERIVAERMGQAFNEGYDAAISEKLNVNEDYLK